MRVDVATLQMRISRLRQLIAECPAPENVQEEIKQILKKAPHVLQKAEEAVQLNDPLVLNRVYEVLKIT